MGVLDNLSPAKVFHYFEEISNIPRGSGNEKEICEYCVSFAKAKGLEVYSDSSYNVLIKKPAAAGKESKPGVILQGHLDMVCEKNAGVEHDFLKDPLKLKVDGDNLFAQDTTLGADNGIAVAMMLAVLDSGDIEHPPLECLFTSEEELGLRGAVSFDYSRLTGTNIINMDTEEYGQILVSCSGGLRAEIELPVNLIDCTIENYATYAVRIRGLKGGHSGMDIHLERANANKLLGRVLDFLHGKLDFEICSISGGAQDNAIPREAQAYININKDDAGKLEKHLEEIEKDIVNEFRIQEGGITIKCAKEEPQAKVFCKETAAKAINIIMTIPNGVLAMSFDIDELVETSNNLGVIKMSEDGDSVCFACAVRSAVESRLVMVEASIKHVAEAAGAKFSSGSRYPGWQFDPQSKLKDVAAKAYKELTGQELVAKAFHAGLECGILKQNIKDADIISLGPDMWEVHTPNERLSIESTRKTYDFLLKIMETI